jgi:MFS-type transporter involved in bile tolerance (Atg22 family)
MAGKPADSVRANSTACATVLCIFQLPMMSALRKIPLSKQILKPVARSL